MIAPQKVLPAFASALKGKVDIDWDGGILAASKALRAGILYSQDLNPGPRYRSVRVLNPFTN